MSNSSLYEDISKELNLGLLLKEEVIQSLWSGYGSIIRLYFEKKNIIIKHVKLPNNFEHPRGWNSNFSHQRKIKSYNIELNWYKNFSFEDNRCKIPKGLMFSKSEDEWLIVMEDLSSLGFCEVVKEANETHIKAVLKWLANFHAKYMHTKTDLLWESGTYWHLETRPEELEALKDKELKKYASLIDEKLKTAKYQTLVHGDAKLANFCFTKDFTSCAAVDFQYVGHGCAMKDVILFLSSALKSKECAQKQEYLLDIYFEALDEALQYYHPAINSREVQEELRPLFSLAWADFQRFIKGWSPNHFKINTYTESLTLEALESLKSK